ncbi:MAG TPA: N-acetyltransferase [Candidatus Latescibacteria bacterium]|nr:N-acetyltransferase [Candidatus Handelsmanbacteria bacterium]HIL09759.1 N-acetyltransferase [Candidatus Latescibacterota bacterium]
MTHRTNEFDQPIGLPLIGWWPPPVPRKETLQGRFCRVEPLAIDAHLEALYDAISRDKEGRSWTYLAYGPFPNIDDYRAWITATCLGDTPIFFAIVDEKTGKAVGVASYLNIVANNGSIEVGHIHYSPLLQQTPAATEAMFLLMRQAFELGYRRYEWKCDNFNTASKAAAQRLGLSYEGIFRQAVVYNTRNRDTAWFAAIDGEWPALNEAFETWLAPENFDAEGRQRVKLSDLTRPIREDGPAGL